MSNALRMIAGVAGVVLMSLSPVASFADDSLGMYQTTDRKMDYDLRLCGNGKQLCVKLSAARGSAVTKQTKPWIGKDIVVKADPTGTNAWKGTVSMQGYTMNGTLVLNPGKNFVMKGCVYVFACADFTLIPAKPKS
jgi:uncharacterized protein (DUF2147 family)